MIIFWVIGLQGIFILSLFTYLIIYKIIKNSREAIFQIKLTTQGKDLENAIAAYLDGGLGETEILARIAAAGNRISETVMLKLVKGYSNKGYLFLMTGLFEKSGLVKNYRQVLKTGKWWEQGVAAQKLGDMRSGTALPELIAAAHSQNLELSLAAARALGKIGGEKALSVILGALSDPQRWTAIRVEDIVVSMGGQAVAPLLKMFDTSSPEVQKTIIEILGLLRDKQAITKLIACLAKDDYEIRIKATKALGQLQTKSAESHLIWLLQDPKWEVRAMAAKSLGQIGSRRALPALERGLRDKMWWVRMNSAQSLVSLGPEGEMVLKKAMTGDDRFAAETAVQMLGESWNCNINLQKVSQL